MNNFNTSEQLKLFSDRFLHQVDEAATKHTTSMGMTIYTAVNNSIGDEVLGKIKVWLDSNAALGLDPSLIKDTSVKFGFVIYNEPTSKVAELLPAYRPPMTLMVETLNCRLFYYVTSEQKGERLLFTITSFHDPENNVTITSKESFFEIILGSLIFTDITNFVLIKNRPTEVQKEIPKDPAPVELGLGGYQYNWLPGSQLAALGEAIQRFIRDTDGCGWLNQGVELGSSAKYLQLRVDQRNGSFVVTTDKSPTININHNYPDHMYPEGWNSQCKMNPDLLKLVLDLNRLVDRKVTKHQVRNQVASVEEWLKRMVAGYNLEINSKRSISGEELMKYYGKK